MSSASARPPSGPTTGQRFWTGFGLAVVGAILFSSKAVVAKLTYRYGVDALTVIGFRMMLSAPFFIAIGAWQAWAAHKGRLPRLGLKDSLRVAFLGFLGYYLSSYLDFLGLQYITAGLERLILFLSPTFVLLITAIWLKRPIGRRQWFALALSYTGVVLVFVHDLSFGGDDVMLGSAFVLAAALTYAFYLISSGELLKRIGSTRLVAYAMTVSSIVTLIHFFAVHSWEGLRQAPEVYQLSLVHAVLQTVLPVFLTMWGVARIGAPLVAQLGMIGPVSVLFLAAWLLGEPITVLQLVGTAIVLAGILVLGRRS
ncbi:DMT family transporter [Paracandidimonas soli]|uniref:Threonine/homoserine efflux transporter RhtA n=1 Tax=Paracandidimonas soli TaxID=1917182 RepID=A0A4R3VB25_9BURK|nr:DMT family transporter [Paracandidimonas soli]TCV00768.1 threonine/homoserine efflux transporter RhtA [Paracandidimonas soli]